VGLDSSKLNLLNIPQPDRALEAVRLKPKSGWLRIAVGVKSLKRNIEIGEF